VSSPTALRLVDLDEVFCASTRRFGTNESGLPAYQHPERAANDAWDHRIDRFSSLVIYTSLRAIASARRPVELLSPGDELVLSADDIKAAARENARDEAWEFLLKSPDGEVRLLAAQLHAACRMRLQDVPSLDDVLGQLPRRDLPPEAQRPAARNGPLNQWGPPAAGRPRVDNQWPTAAPADGAGRRSRAQASEQQWAADSVDGHRRAAAQMPHQTWSGARSTSAPRAAPKPAAVPPRAPSAAARAAGWLAILFGVVLFLIGAGLVASGLIPAIVVAVSGASIVGWGRQKVKR
jgi:hypothetical protein